MTNTYSRSRPFKRFAIRGPNFVTYIDNMPQKRSKQDFQITIERSRTVV